MSYVKRITVLPVFRAAPAPGFRALSTSALRNKSLTDSVKETAETVRRPQSSHAPRIEADRAAGEQEGRGDAGLGARVGPELYGQRKGQDQYVRPLRFLPQPLGAFVTLSTDAYSAQTPRRPLLARSGTRRPRRPRLPSRRPTTLWGPQRERPGTQRTTSSRACKWASSLYSIKMRWHDMKERPSGPMQS